MAAPTSSTRDDSADLAEFGYTQSLHRRLGIFSSFAAAFSYISPATGIFTLFILGIGTLGGAFIWTFPVVALGQFIVALVFAEVSSHFPLAGSVFQWTKLLSNSKPYAWFSGWIYLWAGALTVAAVVATLPLTLIPVINDIGLSDMAADSLTNQKWIAIITLVVITLLNIFGVRVVAIINNTGVLFELLGLFVFAVILALFNNNQGVDVVFDTGGADFSAANFLVAMFMGLFVIYGFDTASTLAEETNDPRRVAPRAVLGSVAAAFVIGFVFLWAMLMAVPGDLYEVVAAGGISPPEIIQANLSNALATGYLSVVAFAIFVCCLAIQASTIRLAYSMARDSQLPGSKLLSSVAPEDRHAGRRLPARRGDGRDLLPQVRRRRVPRDRGERDDLHLLPPRQPGDPAGAAARLLRAPRRPVLARPLGDADQHPGAGVGRLDADQLHVAPRRDQPEAGGDRRAARLRRRVHQQAADPVDGDRHRRPARRDLLRRPGLAHPRPPASERPEPTPL